MLEQWWRNFISDSFIYREYISIFTQEYILNIVSYFWKTRFYLKVNFILFERIYIFFLIEITMLEDVLLRIQVLFNCTRPRFEASFIFFLDETVYSRSTRRGAHPNETNSLTYDYNWSFKVLSFNNKIFLLPRFFFFTSNKKEIAFTHCTMISLNFNFSLIHLCRVSSCNEWGFNFSRYYEFIS